MSFNPQEHQHMRYNPLKGEWVLVSPHRMLRPWDGQIEQTENEAVPEFDETNPLCPGVMRSSGVVTPEYTSTYLFTNDFPALKKNIPKVRDKYDPLFQIKDANGTCKVLCFHPKSNVTIPTMSMEEILKVIKVWIDQTKQLGENYEWVQIFENKGAIMGCSNPHPHCQIWASSFIPNEPRMKNEYQLEYYKQYGQPLLMAYVQKELEKQERIVVYNKEWVVLVPYWAVWPYETMILPRKHVTRFYDLDHSQKCELANIMKVLTTKYDNLFKVSFPYSMGWHGAPTGEMSSDRMEHWVFHGIYYPPLLRSATIRKFMVGYEMLAQAQRDMTPEQAAEQLRNSADVHYTLHSPVKTPETARKEPPKQAQNKNRGKMKKKGK